MNLGRGLNRPRASDTDPPSFLTWDSAPLAENLNLIGPIELQLYATCTAPDTAFFAIFQDLGLNGRETNVTTGTSPGWFASGR